MLNYVSGTDESRRIIIRSSRPTSKQFLRQFKAQDLMSDDVNYEYAEIGKKSPAKKAAKKEKKAAKKAARKEKKGSLVAKIAVAPARAAFLVLVKLNFLKLKDKLKAANKKNPGGLEKFWTKFGGKKSGLTAVLNGIDDIDASVYGLGAIGVLPAAAAALATATPVLIAVKKFLGEMGLFQPKEAEDMDSSIQAGKGDLMSDPDIDKDFANKEIDNNKVAVVRNNEQPGTDPGTDPAADEPGGFSLKDPKVLMIGGGLAVAAFLLMKKK